MTTTADLEDLLGPIFDFVDPDKKAAWMKVKMMNVSGTEILDVYDGEESPRKNAAP